jgi:hypothetical protein
MLIIHSGSQSYELREGDISGTETCEANVVVCQFQTCNSLMIPAMLINLRVSDSGNLINYDKYRLLKVSIRNFVNHWEQGPLNSDFLLTEDHNLETKFGNPLSKGFNFDKIKRGGVHKKHAEAT